MVNKLRDIIIKIIGGAEKIALTGQEMNERAKQLSQGATDQASSTRKFHLPWRKWFPISSKILEMPADGKNCNYCFKCISKVRKALRKCKFY